MAGALVGEAFLSAAIEVLLDRMASRPVLDFFKGQKLDDQLLNKLNITMITVDDILVDAEDKQHTNPRVKRWLDELKDVFYKAEDLLDEIASEVQRSKIEAESRTFLEKMKDVAVSYRPFQKSKKELEEILGKLEYLVEKTNVLGTGLIGGTGGKTSYQGKSTSSIPNESVIYGRDADKEAIMQWMLSDHPNIINNPDVLVIVGIGGLGKTTLAQHVYSDSKTDGYFDKKAWICVSEEEFNVPKVTKNILKGFTESSSDANNLDKLQTTLEEVLKGKKFLLVLDDAWSKDYDEWDNLLKPLRSGKEGSKILVTTRNQYVANCIGTSPTHQLQKLSDKDCWSLFEKHAFKGRHMSSVHPDLEMFGRQMVKECGGLPLAAKLLGGGLRSERNPEKWKTILEKDMLNVQKDSTLPILRLSYRFLPSHLKRCFAYCAVFPKDYEFEKEKLIRLWMAEGLLPQHEDIEQVGEDCFDDLVSRSFFQESTVTESFVMHDLINDLAKSISGEFCFRYGVDGSCEIPERIRHLWLYYDREVDKSIFPIQHLRTVFWREWPEEVENWLPALTRCRVFSCWCPKLPDSIGNLMHLRYLDISYSSMERLPDTVTSLCNLETLILYGCTSLVELPATIFKLINLSLLDIRGTNLRKMPPHMGKLKKLGELDYYIVGRESDCSIKELGPLKRLRGYLCIEKLRNVSQVQEAAEASLNCKEKLRDLELIWNDEGNEDSLHERNVLEQLRPHTNIEQLSISGYAGTRFPDWVGDSSFSNMVELKLKRCRYCTSLPALGQLGSLKRLSIIGFDGIAVVGPEFYGNSNKPPFRCLESLKFKEMLQWQEWVPYPNMDEDDGATAAFPFLRELLILECPNLKEIQHTHHLHFLTELSILGCRSLERLLLHSAPAALKKLSIGNCPNLKEIQPTHHLPSLTRLEIKACGSLERLLLDSAQALKHIVIEDCPNLTEIQPLHHLPSLTRLSILRCGSLERLLLDSAQALKHLVIEDCPNLREIQPTHHLPSLTRLSILRCGSLERLLLDSAQTLKHLVIKDCPNLREIQPAHHLPSLTQLSILRCGSLERLLLDSAPALEELEIKECPNLKEIQPTYHLPSLTRLSIKRYGLLERLLLDSAPALEGLSIEDCPNLKEIQPTHHLPSLARLSILRCGSLEKLLLLDSAPVLQHLKIFDCPNLKEIQCTHHLLTGLSIHRCGSLERLLLDWAPVLLCLSILDCPNLKEIQPTHHPSLESLEIEGCGSLKRLPLDWAPALQFLSIFDCPNLKELQPTHHLPSLESLRIEGCSSLERLLLYWAPALQNLSIEDCPNLKEIQPTSLSRLSIERCGSLERLPLDWAPALAFLSIEDCPNLKEIQPTHHLPSLSEGD